MLPLLYKFSQALDWQLIGTALCAIVALTILCKFVRTNTPLASTLSLPPGPSRSRSSVTSSTFPPGASAPASVVRRISEKYGDVARVSALGQSMIVLGSYTAACALLDDRSANTSDRQHSVMADMYPEPFEWRIVPRSDRTDLISSERE